MQNQPTSERQAVELLDLEYASLLKSLSELTKSVPPELLYRQPPAQTIGENILRSAGQVEQTFGGITANLWDDPFEWTLPETLSTPSLILDYLAEVESVRARAFSSLDSDGTLFKYVAVPSREPCYLLTLLLVTLTRASDYRGRATVIWKMLSDVSTSRFII